MKNSSKNKLEEITSQGDTRIVNGKKTLFLPCVDPEYTPKRKRTSNGKFFNKVKRYT